MGRMGRIKQRLDEAIYHVMTRTAQQTFLFDEDVVREWIYRRILDLGSIYYVQFHAITVMSNHYHIVLKLRKPEPDEADVRQRFEAMQEKRVLPLKWESWRLDEWHRRLCDLSAFMKDLNQSIARYVNLRNGRSGHVWGDRFKSVLIEDGPGLLACMAYVELNPVRAKISEKPSDYRWCSTGRFQQGGTKAAGIVLPPLPDLAFLNTARQRQIAFTALVDHLALGEAGKESSFPTDMAEIQQFVEALDNESLAELVFRRTRWIKTSLILGSKAFAERCIIQFHLQPSRFSNPNPCPIGPGIFNAHQRHGPFDYCG